MIPSSWIEALRKALYAARRLESLCALSGDGEGEESYRAQAHAYACQLARWGRSRAP
jgi:hypothetical protein